MTFIQFYSYSLQHWAWNKPEKILVLNNGFSSVWNYIKNKGEIIWIDPRKLEYPNVTSPVYVSCSWSVEFNYVKRWAVTRPDITFIVGGPAVIKSKLNFLVSNFKTDSRQIYEILNIEPNINLWGLELPEGLEFSFVKYNYSFTITSCYWGKCTFCPDNVGWGEKALDIEDIPVIVPDHNMVWINNLSMKPNDIMRVFPKLGLKSIYTFFLRGDNLISKTLDKVPIVSSIHPMIGVEFPSDKMLKFMNKGTTVDTLIKVILKLLENGCSVLLFLILGWPNLVESDVDEVKEFLDKLTPFKDKITLTVSLLASFVKEDNTISHTNNANRIIYIYDLDEKQKELNYKVLELYRNFNANNYYDDFKMYNSYNDAAFK